MLLLPRLEEERRMFRYMCLIPSSGALVASGVLRWRTKRTIDKIIIVKTKNHGEENLVMLDTEYKTSEGCEYFLPFTKCLPFSIESKLIGLF